MDITEKPIDREKLNFTTKLAYGSGDMGPAITANILVFFLLYFFTNVAGLPAGMAGSILAIGKIGDAINDPIAGILSDRTRTPWGRRIPWMLFGAIPFGFFFFLQWIVPNFSDDPNLNNWYLFAYYIVISILFNLAYTAVNLPYTALTPELTQDYNERTDLNSFRFAFSIGGSILSLILATVIFQVYPGDPKQQYLVLGIVSSLLSVVALFWCVFRIQERGASPLLQSSGKKILGFILTALGTFGIVYSIAQLLTNAEAIGILGIIGVLFILLGFLLVGIGFNFVFTRSENTAIKKVTGSVSIILGILGIIGGYISLIIQAKTIDVQIIASILFGLQFIGFGLTLTFAKTESHLGSREAIEARNIAGSVPEIPIQQQLKIAFNNKAFLYVIGIYLCSWLGVQLTASILIYYVVSWIGMDEAAFPLVAIAVQGTALVMLFFWKAISNRLGKKTVYYLGMVIWIIAQAALFVIQPGQIGLVYIGAIMAGFGVSVAYLIPWSMIPDVIELDELNTGQRREGIFYSFMVLLQKLGLALALFLVGQALEWSGFVQRVPGEAIPVQPDSALLAIRIAIAPLPTIFLVVGLVLTYFYPITKEVHADIVRQLKERKDREAASN